MGFILVVCLGIVLFVTEGTGMLIDWKNIPLIICFSLSLVIYPMVRAIIFLNARVRYNYVSISSGFVNLKGAIVKRGTPESNVFFY